MLLEHLYDYARSRKLLADPAFSSKAVRWIIDLDSEGNMLGQGPIDTAEDGKRGKDFSCPQTTRAKNAGGVSEFLADGVTAVFGLEGDWKTVAKKDGSAKWVADREKNNEDKKKDFWRQMEVCGKSCADIDVCQKYIASISAEPSFLRRDGNSWKITLASGEEKTLGPENFSFRVNGKLLLDDNNIRNWWRNQHATEVSATKTKAKRGLCIVTGQPDQPIAETHGVKIMSVPGGQSSGALLVSFDKDAFVSYGFPRSLNCPTSEDAATAYCTALNALIQGQDSSLRIGGTVLCFWAKDTKAAGGIFASLLNKPDPQSVATFMKAPWSGVERELVKMDQFIAVTLKGCAGRVAVSHWLQEPLEQAIENFCQWFTDLDIQIPPRQAPKTVKKATDKKTEYNPLSIYWLANATVREAKELRPETLTQLYRAALEGMAPSVALIKPILNQLRSKLVGDENYKLVYDQSRFALLKLILNRNRKETDMEIRPQLTADTDDPAYNCGRLLSVLSETQKKAQGYPKGFTGVAERYFGTASASPATVLPLLLRLNRHHLDKIRKSGGNAYEEVAIRNIVAKFKPAGETMPPVFPRHLDLQAQGRFAIGFYQQQAADAAGRAEAKEAKEAEKAA
jgi:CRISPR-associated protein Csd1